MNATTHFRTTYLIETASDPQDAAETLAGEQSAGTFVRVPAETDGLRARHGAIVLNVEVLDESERPALPGAIVARPGEPYRRARVEIAYPVENVGDSLPQLLTTIGGNLFELAPLSGVRVVDVEIPAPVLDNCPGPQFGIEGTRRLAGVDGRPLIGTIVKPSVGLTPAQTAELVETLADAGLDFVKDDELIADPPYSPFVDRTEAVLAALRRHRDRSGRSVMYAANLTGDSDDMRRHHDAVVDHGGNCVMVSVLSVGLAGLMALRRHSDLPIHAHRNGWGALTRHPLLGFDFDVMQKFWRLAGADHIHVNGIDNKFTESNESVAASARSCIEPLGGHPPTVPVFSSGQWAGTATETLAAAGGPDLIHVAGGGIMAHPDGPAAGVESMLDAWEAALADRSVAEHANDRPALRRAFERFGS
ncbi:ribulose-bisphosphate carboxylase large chain [Ilumatobacter fluminis]|uniref:Ribulose-bisphosphate carboxylase large chain n=1 Tax=Ilumatobacter fluminis TaxID=467091 RepID=A0A4V3EIL1_9ACTN|nr:ribulose-bisphosphate carboxylase large subunit family protein [Ilumatobacter fluminis]TDT14918.1 ribulose-bisphosphate carboxylase large chain [Ilumatobacter fluminis]